jgi:hypothetical protein
MGYLATHAFDKLDATIFGGLYQWGRKDLTHGASSTYRRYDGTDNAAPGPVSVAIPADEKFYYKGPSVYGDYSNWYSGSAPEPKKLWGNGSEISEKTDGGVSHNGDSYQKPVKTAYDPCPTGFRVPTQDEWERIGIYDCDPSISKSEPGDYLNIGGAGGSSTAKEVKLTWIPVVCNSSTQKCVPNNNWQQASTYTGYAVYRTDVWAAAITGAGVYSGWDGNTANFPQGKSLHDPDAPEPLLFFPAAGYRDGNNGIIQSIGDYSNTGYYWSSIIGSMPYNTNDYAIQMQFTKDYVRTDLQMLSIRAQGYSIRCVMD